MGFLAPVAGLALGAGAVLGSRPSRSDSRNQAFPWLMQSFADQSTDLTNRGAWTVNRAQNFITGGNMDGFNAYRNSTGYNNIFNEAMRGVTANAATRGLLSSGATLRASQDRAGELAQQQYENYLRQMLEAGRIQLGAGGNLANTIAGAGSRGTSRGAVDLLGGLGALGQGIGGFATLSDIRLKDNIVKIGEEPDGLGIYEFTYKGSDEVHVGVMAQEVAELRPHALGPLTEDGFMTVDYGRL